MNHHLYFHEFVEHAAQYGLQYLAEAEYFQMQDACLTEAAHQTLRGLEADRVRREQYLDFIRGRRFRQTLLCRKEVSLRCRPDPAAIRRLRAASSACALTDPADSGSGAPIAFGNDRGGAMSCKDPVSQAVMRVLTAAWPHSLDFDDLVAKTGHAVPPTAAGKEAALVTEVLLQIYRLGLVELRVHEPRFCCEAGPRPCASPIARLQSNRSATVANLRHVPVALPDEAICKLVRLMDGTRDRTQLAQELNRIKADAEPLDRILEELGQQALLLPASEQAGHPR